MVKQGEQFEYRVEKAIRGTEARSIAKWRTDGWELDSQIPGRLRTELTFRRLKPKTLGNVVLTAIRQLSPRGRKIAGGVTGGVVVLVIAGGVAAVINGGGATSTRAATEPTVAISTTTPVPALPTSKVTSTKSPSTEPTSTGSADAVLTVKNSPDLVKLLKVREPNSQRVVEFAAKYEGRSIEFDGNLADLQNHAGYKTRYDLLIHAGDYTEDSVRGPEFQFENVNVTNDLHFTGLDIPEAIGTSDELHFVARVSDYDVATGLFHLEPVSTEVR